MSLQKLCLDSFVQSIDMYNHVYSVTDNEVLQQGFHILRKAYSYELITQLYDKNNLEEKYANLVFSKFLTSIDTKWFSKCSWETIANIFAKIGPNFQEVSFSTDIYWERHRIFCHLPNVKSIIFEKNCSNEDIRCITEYCARLEKLDLEGSRSVTDNGLKHFCLMKKDRKRKRKEEDKCIVQKERGKLPCPLLKDILLEDTTVQVQSIRLLVENVPSLEKIRHYLLPHALYEIHKDDLGSLGEIQKYKFTHMSLQFTDDVPRHVYEDILKICRTLCPNVKSLNCMIYVLELMDLYSMLPDVEDLDLLIPAGSNIVHISYILKHKCGKLKSLFIRHCAVPLSLLGESCVFLTRLSFKLCCVHYNADDSVPIFSNLKELCFDQNLNDCKAICCLLRSSPVLEKLEFQQFSSTDPELKAEILKCCKQGTLKYIKFINTSVTSVFLSEILQTCSTLETLTVADMVLESDMVQVEKYLCRIAETLPNRPKVSVINLGLEDILGF